jgi:hypothetical protein
MLFDKFPDRDKANKFARWVKETYGLDADVCKNQEESDEYDCFPFELIPPIVVVDRPEKNSLRIERCIEKTAEKFGGEFAGT